MGENIPKAEFGMISAETAWWDHRKKIAKLLMRTLACRSTFLYDRTLCCVPIKYRKKNLPTI
jgi:hypothetical protein